MNNLDKILDKLCRDGLDEREKLHTDAESRISEMNAEYEAKIENMREKSRIDSEREREAILERAKSSAQTREREILLGARVGLIDQAYRDAEKYIYSLTKEEYTSFLAHLLCDAVKSRITEAEELRDRFGEDTELDFEVIFNSTDKKASAEVVAQAKELFSRTGMTFPENIRVSGKHADIKGGLILRVGDIEMNCSVASLVSSVRRDTEGDVARVLLS